MLCLAHGDLTHRASCLHEYTRPPAPLSQVNYVCKAANLYEDAGYQLSGSSYVINKSLGTSWLWDRWAGTLDCPGALSRQPAALRPVRDAPCNEECTPAAPPPLPPAWTAARIHTLEPIRWHAQGARGGRRLRRLLRF